MWRNKSFSVFSRNYEYCGSIELQRPDEKNPELGIDLIEQKRNQGIAKRVINMFVQEWRRTHNVEYFLIRISSRNSHSRHVFEKMGVVKLGTAESSFKSLVKELSERIGENNLNELYDALKKFMGEADELEEEIVYEYKLIPNEG